MNVEKHTERARGPAPGYTLKELLDGSVSPHAGFANRPDRPTGAPQLDQAPEQLDQAPEMPSGRLSIPSLWPRFPGYPVSFLLEEGQRALTFLILANAVYGGALVTSLPLIFTQLVSYRGPTSLHALPQGEPVLPRNRGPKESPVGAPDRAGPAGRRRSASRMPDQQTRPAPSIGRNRTARRAKAVA